MTDLRMYTKPEELEQLTGLSHDELWDAGFNLDDWDVSFQSDKEIPDGWLLSQMDCYCVGHRHVECKGYHYYMAYHS